MRFVCANHALPLTADPSGRQQTAAHCQTLVFQLPGPLNGGEHSHEQELLFCRVDLASNSWTNTSSKGNTVHHSSSGGGIGGGSASTASDSSNAQAPSQQQQVVVPDVSGLVPALFLGDVFITANTVSGILNSSAAAAAEGRMPTARHARAHRAAANPQVDPATALLLQLMQPLPQPFPGSSSADSSAGQQQQQRKLFFVQRESAEFVRRKLLLQRYHEVVAARAAAGLPTTAAPPNSSSSSSSQPVPQHRTSMLQNIQAAMLGGGSSSSKHQVGHEQQQQPQQVSGVGQMLQDLHSKVAHLMPGRPQQQQLLPGSPTATGSANTAPASAAESPGAAAAAGSTPSSSSSSSGMVGAKRSLPTVLAAQLHSFMTDLHTLEEEAVLREGALLLEQQQHNSSSRRGRSSRDRGSSSSREGTSGAQHMFNFASYVARLPLSAVMQLMYRQQQQQQQQQRVRATSSSSSSVDAVDPSASAAASASSGSSGSSSAGPGYEFAISVGDLRACLAIQQKDAFIDLDDNNMSDNKSNKWQLGIYEQDTIDTEDSELTEVTLDDKHVHNGQHNPAATAAVTDGDDGSSSSSSAKGRWRWGARGQTADSSTQQQQMSKQEHQQQQQVSSKAEQQDYGSAAYTPLDLPALAGSSSGSRGSQIQHVALNHLLEQQQQLDDYGEVRVAFDDSNIGVCDRTPVFQVPGLEIVLDTSAGEVSFAPTFLSITHLITLLHTAKAAATKLWINGRRENRKRWRQSVEMSAVALASNGSSGSSSSGRRGGSSRAAAAAAEEASDEDSDGMGEPPEAKALLEELGETPSRGPGSNRTANTFPNISSNANLPTQKGVLGVLNSVALGTISLAAAGCCAVQEAIDQAAVAVPALGEWVIGFPSSVNIQGAFLEDLAAAAAAHNAGRLKAKKPALLPAPTAAAAVKPAAAAAAAAAGGDQKALYDPLGLVQSDTQQQQQQQQQVMAAVPQLGLPCLDGLKLLLAAGWSVVCDVLLGDGRLAAAVMAQGSGRRMGLGSVQVTEEGEIALRLGLTLLSAPPTAITALPNSLSSSRKDPRRPDAHVFEVGIHLNLSRLIGVPSMQHENQLSASRGGLGSEAKGVLLIGDLALEPSEMAEAIWRGPQLGFGLLPVSPLLLPGDNGSSSSSTA